MSKEGAALGFLLAPLRLGPVIGGQSLDAKQVSNDLNISLTRQWCTL